MKPLATITRTARRDSSCSMCGEPIEVGELQAVQAVPIPDGYLRVSLRYLHPECLEKPRNDR